jgi:hypothetical protein
MGSSSLLGDIFISKGSLAASSFTRSAYRSVFSECSHELMPGLIIAICNPEQHHHHYLMAMIFITMKGISDMLNEFSAFIFSVEVKTGETYIKDSVRINQSFLQ